MVRLRVMDVKARVWSRLPGNVPSIIWVVQCTDVSSRFGGWAPGKMFKVEKDVETRKLSNAQANALGYRVDGKWSGNKSRKKVGKQKMPMTPVKNKAARATSI